MWILLTLAVGASSGGVQIAPPALQFPGRTSPAQQKQWFEQRSRPFGSSFRIPSNPRTNETLQGPADAAAPATMTCTLRILEADPKLDPGIARTAPPDIDPKIVRPGPCRK